MGRKRVIDQQAVLDAAERVVGRDGAANLTIDAVAREAGINKASVLYDHKSKQALVEAVVDRALSETMPIMSGSSNSSPILTTGQSVAVSSPPQRRRRKSSKRSRST